MIDAPSQPLPPRPRLPKWPFVLAGVLLLLGAGVVALFPLSTRYVAFAPGTAEDVRSALNIAAPTHDHPGDLLFLTVLAEDVNVFEYVEAVFDRQVDLKPREVVRPPDMSREDLQRHNLASMNESKLSATYVALTRLGYQPTFHGSGALITALVDDSPASGKFESGVDVITAVDGEVVTLAEDAVRLVGEHGPGDTIVLTVRRGDGSSEDVTITLASNPDDPSKGFVGVFLGTADLNIDFPIEVDIDSGNIGGPSAGMMYALGILNMLSPDDLTKGHRVAGTGTVSFDGVVGPIGGVRQKVFAAESAGAEYVLVPTDNYDDAVSAAGDDIEVTAVGTIDDALAFLDSLTPVGSVRAQAGSPTG